LLLLISVTDSVGRGERERDDSIELTFVRTLGEKTNTPLIKDWQEVGWCSMLSCLQHCTATYREFRALLYYIATYHHRHYQWSVIAKESITVPCPLRNCIKDDARSRTAACNISNTTRQPAIAASKTKSNVWKFGIRASH